MKQRNLSTPLFFFGLVLLGLLPDGAHAALRQARYANLDYDVVYVRCPRAREPVDWMGRESMLNWNGVNDMWLESSNNVYQQPGCDLVLHHSAPTYLGLPPGAMGREEVLVNCDEVDLTKPVCTIADPNVSLDGKSIVYAKFTDTRFFVKDYGMDVSGGFFGHGTYLLGRSIIHPLGQIIGSGASAYLSYAEETPGTASPFAAPTLIFKYDLATRKETQISPAPRFLAGRAHPGRDAEWQSNVPVMDTGPFFMPDGRIGFTSNRDSGFLKFQLFDMDADGKNMHLLGHRAIASQLHPATLMDGRIMYTSTDTMLQKTSNNQFSLFTINPDGSNPFILAGKHNATQLTYHFATQLSDGSIVTTLYYMMNNSALGSLLRFPINPGSVEFTHMRSLTDPTPLGLLAGWASGSGKQPFARVGQYLLTPQATPGDNQAIPYVVASDNWMHPYDSRTVTMTGKFSHPSGAPNNGLLTTYTIGGSSVVNSPALRNLTTTKEMIGKDGGVWFIPLEPNGTRAVGHIVDDAQIVVDFPQYHEIMPRAVVPYSRIYGVAHATIRPPTPNSGTKDLRLPAGAPYGLSGAATLFDRETRSFNGTPWNATDGGGAMSGRAYTNLGSTGADLAIYVNSEIYGIRVSMPLPVFPNNYSGGERWAGQQRHPVRILGEFPVRKSDGTPLDGQGNPDTSFMVRVPADTPFLFQTLDKRGMALDIETTSRSMVRGEQQFCGGCHVHTRASLDPFTSLAKRDTSTFGDFTGASAPLFADLDASGKPTVKLARDIYPSLPGINARRSFGVEWNHGISSLIQTRCASCHGEGKAAQLLTGLRLDGDGRTYDLIVKNNYVREDGVTINASSKPGDGLTNIDAPGTDRITLRIACCTVSRWMSLNSARSSMLVWALYGQRLDGRDNTTGLPPASSGVPVDNIGLEHPEIWPKVAEHAAYLSGMPESEKRLLARWIDMGAPNVNVHDDMMRPVLTVTPVVSGSSIGSLLVGVWDDSVLDYSRFKVTANGASITSVVSGSPSVITVTLPTPIDSTNADAWQFNLEIWDKPDRSLSLVQAGVVAANRTQTSYTGRALLLLASVSPNHAPTATSVAMTVTQGTFVEVLPIVTDPDAGDSHIFKIVTLPAHGSASVANNRLVYTPAPGYVGSDSFSYSATDLAGLSVNGVASVTVLVKVVGPTTTTAGGTIQRPPVGPTTATSGGIIKSSPIIVKPSGFATDGTTDDGATSVAAAGGGGGVWGGMELALLAWGVVQASRRQRRRAEGGRADRP